MKRTRLILVLHAHLPWIPRAHRQREWLHEAISDCYLPLLEVVERAPKAKLTLSVSPTVAAMLAEPELEQDFDRFCAGRLERLRAVESLAPKAAAWWRERWRGQLGQGGTVIPRLRRARGQERLELICCNATHAFLPLLAQCPTAVRAQVGIAVAAHTETFGARPFGLWSAECGYYPGLDEVFAGQGLRYFFVDTHALSRATPPASHLEPAYCQSGVAVLARDPEASEQVWSRKSGYPGDARYLDFHHRLQGLRLFRVTGQEKKEVWEPEAAFERARAHAAHFVESRRKRGEKGAAWLVAPYDAELFGHWWLEGPAFLEEVFARAAKTKGLLLSTAGEAVRALPEGDCVQPAASSWGRGGQAAVWLDESNAALWPHLIRACERMEALARRFPRAKGKMKRALDQALRELLLAQGSDWPFLIEAKTSAGYARERFEEHLLAFNRLAAEVERGEVDLGHLGTLERAHNLFGGLDYRVYVS